MGKKNSQDLVQPCACSPNSPKSKNKAPLKYLISLSLCYYAESTLLKLRTGSKLAKGSPFEGMRTGDEMDMVMEADNNSTSTVCPEAVILPCGSMTYDDDDDDGGDSSSNTLPRSIDSDDGSATLSSKHRSSHSKTISIHQMFSRYKDSKAAPTSHDQMMAAENNYSPIMPPNPGRYSCPLDMDQQLEPDCICSITVGSV